MFIFVWVYGLHIQFVCLVAQEAKKRALVPLELKLQTVVSSHSLLWVLGIEPGCSGRTHTQLLSYLSSPNLCFWKLLCPLHLYCRTTID